MRIPRVLLVDDEVQFTTNMAKLLSRRGYEVSAVNDGNSALRLIDTQEFDVVVLDLKMPGKDGITTLREIKRKRPDVEVIILTGYATVDSAVDGMRLGAYDYTMKPAILQEVDEKIKEAFERKLMQEQKLKDTSK